MNNRRAAIALAGVNELSKTSAYTKDSPRAIYQKLKYNYTRGIFYGS